MEESQNKLLRMFPIYMEPINTLEPVHWQIKARLLRPEMAQSQENINRQVWLFKAVRQHTVMLLDNEFTYKLESTELSQNIKQASKYDKFIVNAFN